MNTQNLYFHHLRKNMRLVLIVRWWVIIAVDISTECIVLLLPTGILPAIKERTQFTKQSLSSSKATSTFLNMPFICVQTDKAWKLYLKGIFPNALSMVTCIMSLIWLTMRSSVKIERKRNRLTYPKTVRILSGNFNVTIFGDNRGLKNAWLDALFYVWPWLSLSYSFLWMLEIELSKLDNKYYI